MSYFQILDNNRDCYGVYQDNRLLTENVDPQTLKYTWNYHPLYPAECASLYVKGKSVSETIPQKHKNAWLELKEQKTAFLKSFQNAKIDLNEHCFYDLVPKSFLLRYNFYKNEATKYVIKNVPKPSNYDYLYRYAQLLDKISKQTLNTDKRTSFLYKARHKKELTSYIDYNLFGTVTGRLTTKKHSFPILNIEKNFRSILKPQNHFFVEFDLNAADIRTFISLLGKEQPKTDIHEWNKQNIFKEDMDRSEAKERFFAWFYNPIKEDAALEQYYDKTVLLRNFLMNGSVKTPYNRVIESDEYHALSYLVQSTSNDVVLNAACEIDDFLHDSKSHITCMMHDSVVIDMHNDDVPKVEEIKEMMSDSKIGYFHNTSVSVGKDYGNLYEIS